MPATVTLSTTNLLASANAQDTAVCVASTANITPGLQLFVDQELMKVVSLGLPSRGGTMVNVLRGRGGAGAHRHSNGATVYIGRGDQFYSYDPVGAPGSVVLVSPHINTLNGNIWFAQGDDVPPVMGNTSPSVRWWQLATTTYGNTSLGVATTTQSPTSST
jgi:hypothetical protein